MYHKQLNSILNITALAGLIMLHSFCCFSLYSATLTMCTRLYIQILSTHVLYHASYENTFLHLFYIRGFVFTVVFNHRKYKNENEILDMFSTLYVMLQWKRVSQIIANILYFILPLLTLITKTSKIETSISNYWQ